MYFTNRPAFLSHRAINRVNSQIRGDERALLRGGHRVGEVGARARASDSPGTPAPENTETNGKTTRSRAVDLADASAKADERFGAFGRAKSFSRQTPLRAVRNSEHTSRGLYVLRVGVGVQKNRWRL